MSARVPEVGSSVRTVSYSYSYYSSRKEIDAVIEDDPPKADLGCLVG